MTNRQQQNTQPVVDPLQGCEEAEHLYGNLRSTSYAERLILAVHVADGRTHRPTCPAHDPKLLEELRSQLGINKLPD